MKKTFEDATVELTRFNSEDIFTISNIPTTQEGGAGSGSSSGDHGLDG